MRGFKAFLLLTLILMLISTGGLTARLWWIIRVEVPGRRHRLAVVQPSFFKTMGNWIPAEAFADIARGNKAAEELMCRAYCWTHKQDDLYDGDKHVKPEVSVGLDLQVLHAFSNNPFFKEHQAFLWPVFYMGALAWIASEDLCKSTDVLDRITSQVLKSQYQDLYYATAYCIGGFEHALAMARKYRDYHFDPTEPAKAA
jgi:hypothetical protein